MCLVRQINETQFNCSNNSTHDGISCHAKGGVAVPALTRQALLYVDVDAHSTFCFESAAFLESGYGKVQAVLPEQRVGREGGEGKKKEEEPESSDEYTARGLCLL